MLSGGGLSRCKHDDLYRPSTAKASVDALMAHRASKIPQRPVRQTRSTKSLAQVNGDASDEESKTARGRSKARLTMRQREDSTDAMADSPRASKKLKTKNFQGTAKSDDLPSLEEPRPPRTIPPWHTLPYQVLLQIFSYAAHPLIDMETFHPTSSLKWLLSTAMLCKAFAEPALTVLYTEPPLIPKTKAHLLADLLNADPSTTMFKYRSKVESLLIEVHQVATYSLQGRGVLDIGRMIQHLPRLKALEFYHEKDMYAMQDFWSTIRWSYPATLFEALEYVDPSADPVRGDKTSVCKLQSWRWSSRLAGKKYPLSTHHEIHSKPAFSSLKKIAYVNYQLPDKTSEYMPTLLALSKSLRALPQLEHLVLDSCGLITEDLVGGLPLKLRHIEMTRCPQLSAAALSIFLPEHGNQLRSLTLADNTGHNLAFLALLAEHCPNLEELRVDDVGTFGSQGLPGLRPEEWQSDVELTSWPQKLRSIELVNLHHTTTRKPEIIFNSLLACAHTLPDLRVLVYHGTINVDWKLRAEFRKKWIPELNRVFAYSPKPTLTIAPPSSEEALSEPQTNQNVEVVITNKRRSSRVSMPPKKDSLGVDPHRKSRNAARRSRRESRHTLNYAESSDNSDPEHDDSEPDEEDDHAEDDPNDSDGANPPDARGSTPRNRSEHNSRRQFIQGLCETVTIRIDNQRPMNWQVTEADFVGSEPSGDEDWDSVADNEDAEDMLAW